MLPNLGSPPPPFRKCPSGAGRTNRASAVARTSAPETRRGRAPSSGDAKMAEGARARGPRGCRDRDGPAGGAGKMAAARRGIKNGYTIGRAASSNQGEDPPQCSLQFPFKCCFISAEHTTPCISSPPLPHRQAGLGARVHSGFLKQ
ncbi:TMEM80 isoform 4 [Pongo abelii]|uniref:TMEM80 isoform 4 n=1 Tax=Pongo abelii TaxID=9601 RepID=A0A2J8XSD0_PONAB|nr:TMEM80 isoform 4 [Pongo abelii]